MKKLRKYGIILTTIMTIFSTTLIVTKADTMPVINAIHELYQPYPNNNSNLWSARGVIAINFDNYVTGTLTTTISALDEVILDFNTYVDFYCIGAEATVTANETRITFHIEDEKTILLYYANKYVMNYSSATISALSVDLTYKSKTLDVISHVDATDVNQISGQMATLLSTMNNIYEQDATILTRLTTLNTKTDTIISNLGTITTALNTLQTSINSIDTQIDTISWNTFCNNVLGFTDDFSTYTTNTGSHSERYYVFDVQSTSSWNNIGSSIIRCRIPIGNFTCSDVGIYTYSSSLREVEEYYSYIDQSRTWLYVYFMISPNYSNAPIYSQDLAIKCNPETDSISYYYYNETANAPIIEYITSNDIEYWKLYQCFMQFDYQKKQLNLSQELIDIVSQLTSSNSTETTTNITNFNTNMETINNIENNLSVTFDTSKDNFDTQNESNWSIDTNLLTSAQNFQTVFTNMLGYCEWEGTLLSLILLCAVLMAILG